MMTYFKQINSANREELWILKWITILFPAPSGLLSDIWNTLIFQMDSSMSHVLRRNIEYHTENYFYYLTYQLSNVF